MGMWQLSYLGDTKDIADWGISELKRTRTTNSSADVVTFKLDGAAFDTLPFPCLINGGTLAKEIPILSFTRNNRPWFAGIVTKPMPGATGREESVSYEVANPWYILEKTIFQQQWVTSASGAASGTVTTTRSNTILGQSLNGIKMDSGKVLKEVLLYAQYAFQMLPFPDTVNDVTGLPAAPASPGPYIIGAITPSITVPYTQLRDRSCADVIRLMMKYSPDAVVSWDYTTMPPTLNIQQRGVLAQSAGPGGSCRTISVLNGLTVDTFKPTPRYDLKVPVVVVKWEQKNDEDGTTFDSLLVESYPPPPAGIDQGVWESQPFALVQTIDLVGGNSTTQKAEMKVVERPTDPSSQVALPWALSKQPNLKATKGIPYVDVGAPLYDTDNMAVAFIGVTIDPNDPLNDKDKNPNNITLPNCPELVNELVSKSFPPWLQDAPNALDVAKVIIEVHLKYTGTDAATQALFWQDPTDASNVLTATTGGVYIFRYGCSITNADTQTYSQLTSWSAGEPAPTGYAKALHEALDQLHFQGTATITEDECSDLLPTGCVFNTSDGNPDWHTMNALVTSVDEDIDRGTTVVRFGPPPYLSLELREEIFRANLGRLPSFKLQQRTSGMLTAGSNVVGAEHAATTHVIQPPSPPGAVAVAKPFDKLSLIPVSGSMTEFSLTLKPGVINANLYPKIGGVRMWVLNTVVVAGVTTHVLPTLTVSKGDTVWIEGTVAAGILTSAIINHGPTVTAETDNLTTRTLGTLDPTTGAWTQAADGNQLYVGEPGFFSAGTRLIDHRWASNGNT